MEVMLCPACGHAMRADSVSCPSCRTPVEPMVGAVGPAPAAPSWVPPPPGAPSPPAVSGTPPPVPVAHAGHHPAAPTWGPGGGAGIPPAWVPPAPPPATRRVPPLVVATIVVLLVAAAAGVAWWQLSDRDGSVLDGAWKRTTTASGRFSVELPGTARRATRDVVVAGLGPVSVGGTYVGDGGLEEVAPGVVVVEVSPPGLDQLFGDAAGVVLPAGITAVVEQIGGTDVTVTPHLSPLGTAVSFTATGADHDLSGIAILNGPSVVGVVVTAPPSERGRAEDVLSHVEDSLRPV